MPIHPSASPASLAARGRQRGIYALEWAIIFPVFFLLLYATLSFGLTFLVRQSMQWAVEDGARAALQHQATREQRMQRALQVAQSNLSWLINEKRPGLVADTKFSFKVCRLGDSSICTTDMSPGTMPCDVDKGQPCMVQLHIDLPYAKYSFTPSLSLGLMEASMPNLQAQAHILVDQKGF